MRNKGPLRKRNVLSVRITDSEMGQIQDLMDMTRLSASDLLREALLSYADRTQWKKAKRSDGAREARAA